MLPGFGGPGMMLGASGGSTPTFLDYQEDTGVDFTANGTTVAVPSNCDIVVGIFHGKNGTSFSISSWTLNSIAYTSTGLNIINSSDNNGYSRVMIVYWPTSSTGTGSILGTCTANKQLGRTGT